MEARADGRLRISEVFASLQGESSWVGIPCVFVRLSGCPLRCTWCDTTYAFSEGEAWTIPDLVHKVRSYGLPLVEVTGGEPLAQEGCVSLLKALLAEGFRVLLETSGALSIDTVPEAVTRIVDVKCPGSGEEAKNLWANLGCLRPEDEVKFVLRDKVDYDYARDVIRRFGLEGKCGLLLSPIKEELDPALLAEWMLRDRLKARLNLQLHKTLWGPAALGR
jgi:7-carboxy-7-deazaguanine synthase